MRNFFGWTIAICFLVLLTANGGAAEIEISIPNGGEVLSGDDTVDFSAYTNAITSSFVGNIYVGSSPGSTTYPVATNIDLIDVGGIGLSGGWIQDDDFAGTVLNHRPEESYQLRGQMQVFYYEGKYRAVSFYLQSPNYYLRCYEWDAGSESWSETPLDETGVCDYGRGISLNIDAEFGMRFTDADIFTIGSSLYLVSYAVRIDSLAYATKGYKYNLSTHTWEDSATIISGLEATPLHSNSRYNVFYLEGETHLLQMVDRIGTVDFNYSLTSYTWGGSGWDSDGDYLIDFNLLDPSLGRTAGWGNSNYEVFVSGGELYKLEPFWNPTTPLYANETINGLKWSGTAWVTDSDINVGLMSASNNGRWDLEVHDFFGETLLWETEPISTAGYTDTNSYVLLSDFYNTTASTDFEIPFNTRNYADGTYYATISVTGIDALGDTDIGTATSGAFFTIDNTTPGAEGEPPPEGSRTGGVGIYVQAIEEGGLELTSHTSKMHDYKNFSADSSGVYQGRIKIDSEILSTCNYTWNCQTDLSAGTHSYELYSIIGKFLYSGHFTVDLNQTIVKIYVPITYNVFDIYEDSSETSLVECNDIYSVDLFGDASKSRKISTSLLINEADVFLDDSAVIPRNCYTSVPYNINPIFPFALPGYSGIGVLSGIEPLHIQYTDSTGGSDCENGCLLGSHLLGGFDVTTISGSRSRQGILNFYKLDAISEYYPLTGQSWSGYVSQVTDFSEDGQFSPLASITQPEMNIDSALYGDADYNPGDFGTGENVYCETRLFTYGYTAYDVNVLLITDRNAIYASYNFSPYKKYNSSLTESTNNGWGNIVWHKFLNISHVGEIQCAFQVSNEIGYKSGWAYSKPRYMWGTSQSAPGGIGIIVKENDGTLSINLHRSPTTLELNKIDVLNYEAGTLQTLDSENSPYTLEYGDNVVAYTGTSERTTTSYNDGSAEADFSVWGTSVIAVDFNESGRLSEYDLNFYIREISPNGDLHIYICNDDYNRVSIPNESAECLLSKTYAPGSFAANYDWYNYTIPDANIDYMDSIFIVFACEDCTPAAKKYEVGQDTTAIENRHSYQDSSGGISWNLASWDFLVNLSHLSPTANGGEIEIASKIFGIGRGDIFDISLYLPDYGLPNTAPVGRNTTMLERTQYSRIECKTGFYDTWLDFTKATFNFWTNKAGSNESPLCTAETTVAYTTNCNPNDLRTGATGECFATNYNDVGTVFLSECAEDNDCWVQNYFSKGDCVALTAGSVIGYCSIELEDAEENSSTVFVSASITVQQYQIFALCDTYTLVNGEKKEVIFTQQDTGYIDCIVGLDNVLTPDSNFSIIVEGKQLDFLRSDFDEYLEQTTYVFRSDITTELEAYATAHSVDNETWEGEIPVFVSHPIYGTLDTFVHAAITFEGERYISDEEVEAILVWGGEGFFGMSQEGFEGWLSGMMNGFFIMLTNPVAWIQGNFFLFIIVIFLIIIIAPLVLYGMAIAAKGQKSRGE